MTTFLIILAVLVLGGLGLRLAVPTLSKDSVATGILTENGTSTLGDCPDSPNCQGSESSRAPQTVDRFAVSKPASESIEILAGVIESLSGTQIVTKTERYLHATFRTPLMGYTDDVEFLVSDDGQSVQVRSASRLGKSDLGANARRIERLRQLVEGRL